ncbi:MAG TPA: CRTAC1 family protein [Phycisphaerales bacterium]|nr:CRTAC1 family protein [Phycisphaerales bacterium]HMP37113.1 CRTAC1 family protein [Phycisphaerales bacterium]
MFLPTLLMGLAACDREGVLPPASGAGEAATALREAASGKRQEAPRAAGEPSASAGADAGASIAALDEGTLAADPPFAEIAEEAGLVFTWSSGHAGRHLNPEIVGGGVALIDYDGDGDLDVYFVQGGSVLGGGEPNRLFRNDGGMRFVDVTESAGVGDPGYGFGVAVGDYDNDGRCDLYVTNLGRNTLYRNRGDGTFEDVTEQAGVGELRWSSSAAFVDFDGDGHLDLYVCNYLNWSHQTERDCRGAWDLPDYCSPAAYRAPARDTLYRNRGDGTFEDVTELLGIDGALGTGLGVGVGDFTGDGRMEIFVANDGMMNHFWVRGADGRFRDEALLRGCATDEAGLVKAGMGVAVADLDGDGDLDILVVNLQRETDSLFRNEGSYFRDATANMRLTVPSRAFTRFGVGFFDFDNDGRIDLYYANGRVQRRAGSAPGPAPEREDPYAEVNLLLRGVGDGGRVAFEEWLPRGGTSPSIVRTSRGAAFGDLDGDGAIDIVVVNRDAPAMLLRNVAAARSGDHADRGVHGGHGGHAERGDHADRAGRSDAADRPHHWIMARVLEASGRHALGAEVRFSVGGRAIRRDVAPALSYCSSNDPRVHLGLGDVARVDAIEVRWADGATERFPGSDAGRIVELRRGAGEAVPARDAR